MEKFTKINSDFLCDLPIQERINYFKKIGKDQGVTLSQKQAKYFYKDSIRGEKYRNNIYAVEVYRDSDADDMVLIDEWKGNCTYLAIRRHDKEICNDWRHFQQIKNELVGEEIEAMQIYPAESRLTDTANQYWLFCLPKDGQIPFGFKQRNVDYTEQKGGFRKLGQRGTA